jgi:hypothetical protein
MSPTHRRTGQRAEARAARLSARRAGLTGSASRADRTGSDSIHPRLYVERKLRARSAVGTLGEATRASAHRKGKVAAGAPCDKGRRGRRSSSLRTGWPRTGMRPCGRGRGRAGRPAPTT